MAYVQLSKCNTRETLLLLSRCNRDLGFFRLSSNRFLVQLGALNAFAYPLGQAYITSNVWQLQGKNYVFRMFVGTNKYGKRKLYTLHNSRILLVFCLFWIGDNNTLNVLQWPTMAYNRVYHWHSVFTLFSLSALVRHSMALCVILALGKPWHYPFSALVLYLGTCRKPCFCSVPCLALALLVTLCQNSNRVQSWKRCKNTNIASYVMG